MRRLDGMMMEDTSSLRRYQKIVYVYIPITLYGPESKLSPLPTRTTETATLLAAFTNYGCSLDVSHVQKSWSGVVAIERIRRLNVSRAHTYPSPPSATFPPTPSPGPAQARCCQILQRWVSLACISTCGYNDRIGCAGWLVFDITHLLSSQHHRYTPKCNFCRFQSPPHIHSSSALP